MLQCWINKMRKKHYVFVILFICIMLFVYSLTIGSYPISIDDIFSKTTDQNQIIKNVFYNLRLPRVTMGLLVGLVLGLAGAIYQIVFSNALASPDLTGVVSGASFGAAIAIVSGINGVFMIAGISFITSILALLLVLLLVKITSSKQIVTYLLSGVIVSALCNAGMMMLKYVADPLQELGLIDFWTMGSLSSVTVDKLFMVFVLACIPYVVLLFLQKQISMLLLGSDNAKYLGINVHSFQVIILLLSTVMVASVLSVTGVISFVGLVAPHIAYFILKSRTKYFLFVSSLLGSIIVLIGDILARAIMPGVELPLSVLTTLISCPILFYWMYQKRGVSK